MIGSVAEFARYWEGVRRRTWVAVDRVGPELLDWAPRPGEMTCGEIVRHLAGAERFFVTKVVEDRFTEDLDPGPALDHAQTRARLESVHRDEMVRLAGLEDRSLASPRRDLDGATVKAWRFLMAMVEHEVHHRSQLDCYLALAGVEPPQIFGRRMEDVLAQVAGRSAGPVGGPR
ncbi:MAG TPA: DinB family protein [Verrucomicrobiae bacterium]|jgi:uncharacterized damage-inducible protein DinB|nr:DinB family protein [Verrucomicrobiae bacterium]